MATPVSQSTVWFIEEKHLPELRLSLFEYSKQKASPAEMADEPIKANTKYARRIIFICFFSIMPETTKETYHRKYIIAIVVKPVRNKHTGRKKAVWYVDHCGIFRNNLLR
jgi:hypothetical protein